MTSETRSISYGQGEIAYSLTRRPRATLEIGVEPDASVSVVAPLDATDDAIEAVVRKRATWVRKQQRYFSQFHPRTPARQFLPGETHLYLGRQYRLRVVEGPSKRTRLLGGYFVVETPSPQEREDIRAQMDTWYRAHARPKFEERLEASLLRFPVPQGFRPRHIEIKSMRQRWASMSPRGRLTLNIRLIQAPTDAIDYVLTHELCHIEHPHHGRAFFEQLDQAMPDWRVKKAKLERALA